MHRNSPSIPQAWGPWFAILRHLWEVISHTPEEKRILHTDIHWATCLAAVMTLSLQTQRYGIGLFRAEYLIPGAWKPSWKRNKSFMGSSIGTAVNRTYSNADNLQVTLFPLCNVYKRLHIYISDFNTNSSDDRRDGCIWNRWEKAVYVAKTMAINRS